MASQDKGKGRAVEEPEKDVDDAEEEEDAGTDAAVQWDKPAAVQMSEAKGPPRFVQVPMTR
jgi:hypothetical protein